MLRDRFVQLSQPEGKARAVIQARASLPAHEHAARRVVSTVYAYLGTTGQDGTQTGSENRQARGGQLAADLPGERLRAASSSALTRSITCSI